MSFFWGELFVGGIFIGFFLLFGVIGYVVFVNVSLGIVFVGVIVLGIFKR